MSDLTPEKLAELRADIAALPEGMHHPHWSGNTDNPGHMELSAWVPGWGRTSLMRPTRWGMQGAKFQFLNPDTVMMEDADRLVKFEVGNPNVTGAHRRDGSVYRGNIAGIDHPVARLIVAALEYIPALLDAAAERDALAAAVERVRALHHEGAPFVRPGGQDRRCSCGGHWPCPTIRALDESETDHA